MQTIEKYFMHFKCVLVKLMKQQVISKFEYKHALKGVLHLLPTYQKQVSMWIVD